MFCAGNILRNTPYEVQKQVAPGASYIHTLSIRYFEVHPGECVWMCM